MAKVVQKQLVSIDSTWRGPFEEEFPVGSGQVSKFWEAMATVKSSGHDSEKNIIRVFSERIAQTLIPATYNMSCIGKTEQGVWRQKITTTDNPDLKTEDSKQYAADHGSQGPTAPPEAPSAPKAGTYTLPQLTALYGGCYAGVCAVCSNMDSAPALAAATNAVFDAALANGIVVVGGAEEAANMGPGDFPEAGGEMPDGPGEFPPDVVDDNSIPF